MRDLKAITEEIFRHHREGRLDIAESMYDQALSQLTHPDPNILYGYGSLCVQKERFGVGCLLLEGAARVYDKHPGIWTNLGVAYKYLGRDEQAIAAYDKAYALDPNAVEVLAGMSGYYINRDEPKKAEELARRGLAIGEHPALHMHLGLSLLEQGRFQEAWPHYEYRWETEENKRKKRNYSSPKWDGRYVKKLVIHGEQGLGDEILYMSLFSKAKERADEIVIECATRLVPLFSKAFGVRCYGTEKELCEHEDPEDAHIAMGSLPFVLGLPDGKPFLPRPNVKSTGTPTIGIAWKGGVLRTNKNYRSLHLKDLLPVFDAAPKANFISVQYGGKEIVDEIKELNRDNFILAGELTDRDFDSLQYRIGICDLVISVCQTAVHQAGAMGVPCWVLTPKKTSWLFCNDAARIWYPSCTIYQQKTADEWSEVIERAAQDLRGRYAELAA